MMPIEDWVERVTGDGGGEESWLARRVSLFILKILLIGIYH